MVLYDMFKILGMEVSTMALNDIIEIINKEVNIVKNECILTGENPVVLEGLAIKTIKFGDNGIEITFENGDIITSKDIDEDTDPDWVL